MTSVNQVILAMDSSLAVSIVVKATFVLTLALMGAFAARRSHAALRHTLLATAFGVLLLLPVVAIVAPPLRIALATQEYVAPIASLPSILAERAPGATSAGLVVAQTATQSAIVSLSALLISAWLCGATLCLIPVLTGLRQLRLLRRSGLPWLRGQALAEGLTRGVNIRRHVDLLLHEEALGPMTCGTVHPAIILPPDADQWDTEDLNRALTHELEHVRRRDWISQCFARILCAVYWFHPLIWIARRQLVLEAERACDDAVLASSEGTAYADQLVGLAQRLSSVRKSPALAMASRADLAARIRSVLNKGQRRGRTGRLALVLAWSAAAAFVVTLSPIRVVAAVQAVTPQPVELLAAAVPLVAGPAVMLPPAAPPRAPRPPILLAQAIPQGPVPQPGGVAPVSNLKRFSANSTLVITDVAVKDQNGKVIEGLRADDFIVTEDGKRQNVNVVEFQSLGQSVGPQSAFSSYYVIGYYTTNDKQDGSYRRVGIAIANNPAAMLDYRSGYYGSKVSATEANGAAPGNGASFGVTGPFVLTKRDPEYSEQARKAKYAGTVLLNIAISASGDVTEIKLVKSLGMGLDQKAVEAVQRWTFKPGTRNGAPVDTQAQVEVTFRLI